MLKIFSREIPLALATLPDCKSAFSRLIWGSRPLADAVTASAGIGIPAAQAVFPAEVLDARFYPFELDFGKGTQVAASGR